MIPSTILYFARGSAISIVTVLLVDDHQFFRRFVRSFLGTLGNVSVVGEASNGIEAVELAETLHPDVVLMDISMPLRNGIDAARIIKQRLPSTKVWILSMHDNPVYRQESQDARVDGYVLKSDLKANLVTVFQDALLGNEKSRAKPV